MAELPAIAERRIGPFPVVAWAGLIGGGAVLGLVLRRRMANKPASADSNVLETIDENTGAGSSSPASSFASSASSAGRTYTVPTPAIPQPANGAPTNNNEWERAAIVYLTSTGADAAAADTAIRRYLAGYALSSGEYKLVSQALASVGPPPEGGIPPIERAPDQVPTAPSPVTPAPQAPPPPSVRPPGALVSDDGGHTVLWTDYSSVQWVQNGLEAIRLWREGASVAGDVDNHYPVPLRLSRGEILAIPNKIGPAPSTWGGQWA